MSACWRRVPWVGVRQGETVPMLLATAYGFSILFAYYLLRPVRDEIGAADRGNLQLLWTAVFLVMLLAVPLYSVAVARLRRVQAWSRLMARSSENDVTSMATAMAAAPTKSYCSSFVMIKSGVISVLKGRFPEMKTTDPYSPTARAKESATLL